MALNNYQRRKLEGPTISPAVPPPSGPVGYPPAPSKTNYGGTRWGVGKYWSQPGAGKPELPQYQGSTAPQAAPPPDTRRYQSKGTTAGSSPGTQVPRGRTGNPRQDEQEPETPTQAGPPVRGRTGNPNVDNARGTSFGVDTREPFRDPSRSEITALQTAGWTVPELAAGGEIAPEWLGGEVKALADHSYRVSDQDWDAMQGLGLRANFAPPASVKQGPAPTVSRSGLQSIELTKEAYDALSDVQRQAVDFNTLLVQAREKDLSGDIDRLNNEQVEGYNETVRGMFGDGSGSNTMAPTTVGLLSDLGIDLKAGDLDQFLSLERTVSLDQLADFEAPRGMVMGQLTETAVQQAGEYIAQALKNNPFQDPIVNKLRSDEEGNVPIGWGNPEARELESDGQKEAFFQSMYGGLSDPANTYEDLMYNLESAAFTQEDMNELWQYFDDYSKYETSSGLWQNVEGRRSPDEIRALVGLED